MHVPVSAVWLARSMLWLSRARATGVLRVRSEYASCQFRFIEGALDASKSDAAQLCERMRVVFGWSSHRIAFSNVVADVNPELIAAAPLIVRGMRARVAAWPDCEIEPGFELTAWGATLLEASGELALLTALQLGGPAANGGGELAATWRALRAFRAIVPPARTRIDYALLLRKRAELRRRAGARELLDFPPDANVTAAEARSALRRLSLHLHPDCLGPDAPAAARALTTEVMQALTRAASSLA